MATVISSKRHLDITSTTYESSGNVEVGGRVGIGTDNPLDLIHAKSSTADSRMILDGATGFDAELKFAENQVVKYTIGHDAAADNFVIGTTNVDTGQRLVINSSGYVGIKETSPDTLLHITQAGGSNQLTLERTGGGAGKAVLAGAASGLIVYDDVYTQKMYVGTSGSYNGNVGIGTVTPSTRLEVVASATASVDIAHFSNSNDVVKIKHSLTSTGSGITSIFDASNNEDIRLSAQSDSWFNAGNVGIGTTTPAPSAKLTVMGNQTFGLPGNGTNTQARFISIEGNADSGGEGSGRIFFTEHNSTTEAMDKYGMSIGYRGGNASIVGASGNSWSGLSQIENGQWGMFGHNNDSAGAVIMRGDRGGSYIDLVGNEFRDVSHLKIRAGNGFGIRFWQSSNYSIFMHQSNAGRLDTLSDYNMYFKMTGDFNRGFVFLNNTTPKAQIDGNGKLYLEGGIQVNSTDSVKMPVGTTAQRPSSPTAGMFRYNSTDGQFEGYTTEWGEIGGIDIANGVDNRVLTASGADSINAEQNLTFDGSLLSLNGKLTASRIETTQGDDNLSIGAYAGNIGTSTGLRNTALGVGSFKQNTSGSDNTAAGRESLKKNGTGYENAAFGSGSLRENTDGNNNSGFGFHSLRQNSSGGKNTAVGHSALQENTSGSNNTAVGKDALERNTTGGNNVGIGFNSFRLNTTGNNNTGVGYQTAQSNTTGERNTALGYASLRDNTTGSRNSGIGYYSLRSNTTGELNLAAGYETLEDNTTGSNNTAVGTQALNNNTGGDNHTALGYGAMNSNTWGSASVAVGYNALATTASALKNVAIGYNALGETTNSDRNVAIGYDAGRLSGLVTNTSSDTSIFIGNATTSGTPAVSTNEIVIGDLAVGKGSNTAVIGNTETTSHYLMGNGAVTVPKGLTTARPTAPEAGMIRFNTINSQFEGYNGTAWVVLG